MQIETKCSPRVISSCGTHKKTRLARRVTWSKVALPPQLANAVGVISSEERF